MKTTKRSEPDETYYIFALEGDVQEIFSSKKSCEEYIQKILDEESMDEDDIDIYEVPIYLDDLKRIDFNIQSRDVITID